MKYKILLWLIIISSLAMRIFLFQFQGGDQPTYKMAVEDFYSGRNPYAYTVSSYQTGEGEHGYAYLPTLLYIQTFFYWVNRFFNLDKPLHILWKIPILISDYLVAFLIFKEVVKRSKNVLYPYLAVAFWLFNPYILTRFEINSYDVIGVALLVAGLFLYERGDAGNSKAGNFWCGILLLLAGSIKLFSFSLIPYIFFRSKRKLHFVLGMSVSLITIMLPFFKSFSDLSLMIQGSILVHSDRDFQGRPFIALFSLIAQQVGINLTSKTVFAVLAVLSLLIPTALSFYFYVKKKSLYTMAFWVILTYLLMTPVLSRSHVYWLFPFLLIVLSEKTILKQYIFFFSSYFSLYLYLFLWNSGFDIDAQRKVLVPDFNIRETRLFKLYKYGKYQTNVIKTPPNSLVRHC